VDLTYENQFTHSKGWKNNIDFYLKVPLSESQTTYEFHPLALGHRVPWGKELLKYELAVIADPRTLVEAERLTGYFLDLILSSK
jgi:hypothetical protein